MISIYLAGNISGKKIKECSEWRRQIEEHFNKKAKWQGELIFLDPLNGGEGDDIDKEGLTSILPPQAIVDKDYLSVKKSDIIIANMDTFGCKRPPIGCYDKETEVLTDKGWFYWKNIIGRRDLKFATINIETEQIQYQSSIRYFKIKGYNKLFHIKSNRVDLMVTDLHNLLERKECSKKLNLIKAKNANKRERIFIPKGGKWEGKKQKYIQIGKHKILMEDFVCFLGIWLADGSIMHSGKDRKVFISQKKEKYMLIIKKLLSKLPYNVVREKNNFLIRDKDLYVYLKNNFYKGDKIKKKSPYNCYNKKISKTIKDLDKPFLEKIIEWMIMGDGHKSDKYGYTHYFTSSRLLRDDFQEICLKLNMACNYFARENRPGNYLNGRLIKQTVPQYTLILHKTNNYKLRTRRHFSEVYYDDYVYCCEVPNKTLYVRRNGKATWCGNTICECTWAYDLKKPLILITDHKWYTEHPFMKRFASWIVKDVQELLDKKVIEQYYKAIHTAQY